MSYNMDLLFIGLVSIAVTVGIIVGVIVPAMINAVMAIVEYIRDQRKKPGRKKKPCAR